MLRLTGKVQRGIGSIRQDVNVSIRDGARVEIKGYQDLDTIDLIIEREVERQQKLLEIKKILLDRDAKVGSPKEVSELFKGTGVAIIKKKLDSGGMATPRSSTGSWGCSGGRSTPEGG